MSASSLSRRSLLALGAGGLTLALAGRAAAATDFGVMVMAHGGGAVWNGEVEAMLAPLRAELPLEVAFGMAEAASLQAAVQRLEARGVRRIGVVRLFISGESWLERTEQILGVRPGAAPKAAHGEHDPHGPHGSHDPAAPGGGHDMGLWRIETRSAFAIGREGLAEAPEMGEVLVERVRGLSRDPASESVLILAHGPEDDGENERWLARIDARAESVRRAAPFRAVQVTTLREDWPEKRVASEARIRDFVAAAGRDGGRALVIPYRVSGFGPYKGVLEGLSYVSDGKGLIPSTGVEHWVRRQIAALRAGPFLPQVAQDQTPA